MAHQAEVNSAPTPLILVFVVPKRGKGGGREPFWLLRYLELLACTEYGVREATGRVLVLLLVLLPATSCGDLGGTGRTMDQGSWDARTGAIAPPSLTIIDGTYYYRRRDRGRSLEPPPPSVCSNPSRSPQPKAWPKGRRGGNVGGGTCVYSVSRA